MVINMKEHLLALRGRDAVNNVVILPLGSLENHGVLPLGTDTLIASCVAERAVLGASCPGVLVAPLIPYTVSIEHTIPRVTAEPDTFIRYLVEVSRSLLEWSKGLVLAVFHGGVYPVAYMAARRLRVEGLNVAVFNSWDRVTSYLEKRYGVRVGLMHADPVEASLLLACGYSMGVKEAGKEDVINALKTSKQREPRHAPWVHRDVPSLYPSEEVTGSKELGRELLDFLAQELADYTCSLAGRDS